jgi:hypothetical protein
MWTDESLKRHLWYPNNNNKYEAGSSTLRKERTLKLYKIRMLRRKFGPKWQKVTEEQKKQFNPELYHFCSLSNIIMGIKLQ